MKTYQARGFMVEAVQITDDTFDAPHPNPEHIIGVTYDPNERGVFLKEWRDLNRESPIDATEIAFVGDWIVRDPTGGLSVWDNETFQIAYESAPVEPVPAPELDGVQSILREFKAEGAYEFKAETAPEAFLQQEIKSLLADLDEALSAPVPAPRLEWKGGFAPHNAGNFRIWANQDHTYHLNYGSELCGDHLTLDAAKSLAESLAAVLAATPKADNG